VETQSQPDPFGLRLPLTTNLRIKLFLTGILFPIPNICMGLNGTSASISEPWQSGTTEPYVVLFLQQPGLVCFLPLIIFSMVALGAIVWKPTTVEHAWVRLGLYTGAIVSFQFLVAVVLTSQVISIIFASMVGPALALLVWGASKVVKKIKRFTIFHVMIATAVVAVLLAISLSIGEGEVVFEFLSLPFPMIIFAAPTLNFVTYARMAMLSGTHESIHRKPITIILAMVAAIIAWVSGFVFAWRLAIQRVLEEYQNLPTTDPNCFVASAAAYGNPSLVKATLTEGKDGLVLLNRQMQRLKFLELALQSGLPTLHRRLRAVYNRFGPWLAAGCKDSPLLANTAYLLLSPLEVVAEFVRRLSGVSVEQVKRIYRR